MKTYSIGRDLNCDIIINDNTDVISRRHALLNVLPSGKMTIIDQSSNGTYVNGIRISPNVPVPVSRKDTVSLAHVARLDWNLVPKPNGWVKYVVAALIAIVVLVAGVSSYRYFKTPNGGCATDITQNDTINKLKADSIRQKQQEDSIKQKQREDSIKKQKRAVASKPSKQDKNKGDNDKSKDNSSSKAKDKDKATDKEKDKDKSKGNSSRVAG